MYICVYTIIHVSLVHLWSNIAWIQGFLPVYTIILNPLYNNSQNRTGLMERLFHIRTNRKTQICHGTQTLVEYCNHLLWDWAASFASLRINKENVCWTNLAPWRTISSIHHSEIGQSDTSCHLCRLTDSSSYSYCWDGIVCPSIDSNRSLLSFASLY